MDHNDHEGGAVKREQFEDDVALDDDGEDLDEPNEYLNIQSPGESDGLVWMVKLPKSLMEKWSKIANTPDTGGMHLATLRVYNSQRIELLLPDKEQTPAYDIGDEPPMYVVSMQDQHDQQAGPSQQPFEAADTLYVVGDKPLEPTQQNPQPNKRARRAKLSGKIHHRAMLRLPEITAEYEAKIRKRALEANRPKRQLIYQKTDDVSAEGGMNGDEGVEATTMKMMQSGAMGTDAGFALTKKTKPAKGEFERAARISRDELLDILFTLFSTQTHWSMKDLRARTNQPEAYLKEIMAEIGTFHRTGQNNNMWSLNEMFATGAPPPADAMAEGGPDEDEDDDMEEVA